MNKLIWVEYPKYGSFKKYLIGWCHCYKISLKVHSEDRGIFRNTIYFELNDHEMSGTILKRAMPELEKVIKECKADAIIPN